ncbi:MAG: hypothetical protein K0S47_125 [Herbinix sp.]|jgi:predicted acetyltransferase|nr:hypothetical protein [Herbinix sp.]
MENTNVIVRKINPSEIIETEKLSSLAFSWSFDEEAYAKKLQEGNPPTNKGDAYALNKWAAFQEDGSLIGCMTIIPYQMYFDGHILPMSGIGCVCTYPQYRRKRAIRHCFEGAIREMYDTNQTFSFLYPFSQAFYRKFGYEPTAGRIVWNFSMNTIPEYDYPGSFSLYDGKDITEFEKAYKKFAVSYNMMVERDEYDWHRLKDCNPFKTNKQAYLYKNEAGEPSGYFIFEREIINNSAVMNCSEFVFDNFDTLRALLSFARAFRADYSSIQLEAARDLRLEYFCSDYPQSSSHSEIKPMGMIRVVRVDKVLACAKYQGTGSISIEIKDEMLPENSGIWSVTFEDGKATSVSKDSVNKADISMTIQVFSTAITGGCDLSDFTYRTDVKVNNADEIHKVFYHKNSLIVNYF